MVSSSKHTFVSTYAKCINAVKTLVDAKALDVHILSKKISSETISLIKAKAKPETVSAYRTVEYRFK